jgi:hypothetical protein
MKRTMLFATAGIFYFLFLLVVALFGIHESALFLGVALAPFRMGPLLWPCAFGLIGRRSFRGFPILMGLHYIGVTLSLFTAKPYEWNPNVAVLLAAKATVYAVSQFGIWRLYIRMRDRVG